MEILQLMINGAFNQFYAVGRLFDVTMKVDGLQLK